MNNKKKSPDRKERKSDLHEKKRAGAKSMRGERGFLSAGSKRKGKFILSAGGTAYWNLCVQGR